MEKECEALPGVAYPEVRDNRSTINTKTGYDDDDDVWGEISAPHSGSGPKQNSKTMHDKKQSLTPTQKSGDQLTPLPCDSVVHRYTWRTH